MLTEEFQISCNTFYISEFSTLLNSHDVLSFHPQAFELLCDLLIMYSKTSVQTTPALQTLVYLPSDSLRADMAAFLVDYIFSDDPELNGPTFTFIEKMCFVDEIFICQHFSQVSPTHVSNTGVFSVTVHLLLLSLTLYPWFSCLVEGEEERKITVLQKRRNQLAGYCKLVIYGVLDLSAATDVFKHYNKVVAFQYIVFEWLCHSRLQGLIV